MHPLRLAFLLLLLATASRSAAPPSFRNSTFAISGSIPGRVAAVDLSGDGVLDLAFLSPPNLGVAIGVGDGSFLAPQTYPICPISSDLAFGDFDGRNGLDIVYTCGSFAQFRLMLNNGAGVFGSSQNFTTTGPTNVIATGDLVGDSTLEVAVSTATVLSIWQAGGANILTKIYEVTIPGTNAYSVRIADFTGDGQNDIILSNNNAANLNLLTNLGGGNFSAPTSIATQPGCKPTQISVADFNNDGKLDVAVPCSGLLFMNLLLGLGNGSFAQYQSYTGSAFAIDSAVGDLDSNGVPDAVAAALTGQDVRLYMSNPPPTTPIWDVSRIQFAPQSLTGVAVADLNKDGRPDIVTTSTTTSGNSVVTILINLGVQPASTTTGVVTTASSSTATTTTGVPPAVTTATTSATVSTTRTGGAVTTSNGGALTTGPQATATTGSGSQSGVSDTAGSVSGSSNSKKKLPVYGIVLIAIGGAAVLAAVTVVIVWLLRKRSSSGGSDSYHLAV